MKAETHALQVVLLTIAGWVNRHQQRVIEYLAEETLVGLRTYYVLFFLELKSRRVHGAELTTNPTDLFMGLAAEGFLGFLTGSRCLIHDRDSKFSLRFRIVPEAAGLGPIKTPFQAPNANAYAERFVHSIKEECLDRLILFGEEHLRHAIDEYLAHYHRERNHQGIGNELIDGQSSSATGGVGSTERLWWRAPVLPPRRRTRTTLAIGDRAENLSVQMAAGR